MYPFASSMLSARSNVRSSNSRVFSHLAENEAARSALVLGPNGDFGFVHSGLSRQVNPEGCAASHALETLSDPYFHLRVRCNQDGVIWSV